MKNNQVTMRIANYNWEGPDGSIADTKVRKNTKSLFLSRNILFTLTRSLRLCRQLIKVSRLSNVLPTGRRRIIYY